MRPIPRHAVALDDAFWGGYQKALRESGLLHQYRMIVESGRLDNFLIAGGKKEGGFRGLRFDDSDVYKWLEAVALVDARGDLKAAYEETVEAVVGAQMADGYLNTHYQVAKPEERWRNLANSHELYCAGHLVEAAITSGDSRLMKTALRFVDLIERRWNEGDHRYDGHPELELALLRLADITGEERHRRLAEAMTDLHGARPSPLQRELEEADGFDGMAECNRLFFKDGRYNGEYAQDHAPIAEHNEIVGHAVRAAYLYAAAARIAYARGDQATIEAMARVWRNTTERRMYVTGGIGSSAANEGFTADYDLPNRDAYAETCAACALAIWGQEMLNATGESEYADTVERALFNGVVSGIGPDATTYFYANPLESRGEHTRVPWFGCACCPPNVARTIGKISDYAFSASRDELRIHFPIAATLRLDEITVRIASRYPDDGSYTLTVAASRRFRIAIRIPGWAGDFEIDAPDELGEASFEGGYAVLDADWRGETTIRIDCPTPPIWVEAHPKVLENAGRVCLIKGPTVYALTTRDGIVPQDIQVDVETEVSEDLIAEAAYEAVDFPDELYTPFEGRGLTETEARFVPYRNWADAGPTEMQVWVRRL